MTHVGLQTQAILAAPIIMHNIAYQESLIYDASYAGLCKTRARPMRHRLDQPIDPDDAVETIATIGPELAVSVLHSIVDAGHGHVVVAAVAEIGREPQRRTRPTDINAASVGRVLGLAS